MSTILIIDDDKGVNSTLTQTITQLGHAVACAYTLAEGLQKAIEARPDVVLLDVHLPDGDGLTALEAVRAAPSEPEVIIFTGEGDPDSAEMAIRCGAWDYLQKPASVAAFSLVLRRALEYRTEKQNRRSVAVKHRGDGESPPSVQAQAIGPWVGHPRPALGTEPASGVAGQAFPRFRAFRTQALHDAERQYLADVMRRADHDVAAACVLAGLSRPRLYALLSKHGMTGRKNEKSPSGGHEGDSGET